jgi:hypothetical protein
MAIGAVHDSSLLQDSNSEPDIYMYTLCRTGTSIHVHQWVAPHSFSKHASKVV